MKFAPQWGMLDLSNPPPGFVENPFPVYDALLKTAPVCAQSDGSFILSRHADLVAVYKDTDRYLSDKTRAFAPKFGAGTPLFEHHTTSLVFNDPPLHTRVRAIMSAALTPKALARMEPGIARMVDQLIDELPPNPDLISMFAARIPIGVIGNLLDIPVADRDPLRGWSLAILGALEPVLSEGQLAAGHSAVREFSEYLTTLIAARRAHPGDPETDVLTRLITGDAAGHLSAQELIHNCIFILNAGHETTTNLIGSGLALLYDNPQSLELLKDDPALIGPAVEEILRVQSPNQFGNRETAVDVQIGGVEIPAGRNLHLCIGAANRDQAVFERPDAFDIRRRPNRHLAFAGGPHVCIGLTLARMEARIALTRFIERHPDYQVTTRRGTGRIRFRGYDMLAADLKPRIFGCATV